MLSLPMLSLSGALLIAAVLALRWLGKRLRLPAGLTTALWLLVLLRLLLPLPLPGWLGLGNAAGESRPAAYSFDQPAGWVMSIEDIAAAINQTAQTVVNSRISIKKE